MTIINGINTALITQKTQKIEKKFKKFFKSLMLSKVKFNDLQTISR